MCAKKKSIFLRKFSNGAFQQFFFQKNFRTKIQAQRKFAQGQNPPASAYLTYNLTSGTETPREKSPERELLPNLRPNTEDFLTFLCFRGTSSLPKELDFTNSLNQPSTSGTTNATKASPDKKKQQEKVELKKKATKKNESAEAIAEKDPKTGFMPFAVRKRAEVHPAKNDKKKMPIAAKVPKKKDQKPLEANSETTNGLARGTRGNPVEEKSTNHNVDSTNNKKAVNKRKSQNAEEKIDNSSTATTSKNLKLEKSPKIEKLPNEKVSSKKKSPKKENDKRQTRLSALKNTPQTATTMAISSSTNDKDDLNNGKELSEDLKKYFSSSDDDEPLLLKIEPKNKKQKMQFTKNADADKASITAANKSINVSQTSIKGGGRGRKRKSPPAASHVHEKETAAVVVEENSIDRKKSVAASSTGGGRKNKKSSAREKEKEKANSQANTTDLSENETRGRPMRKTKEAATIYMELIGRKLTLHDSSDNDSSLDSLEVPNLKRVELMEIELKEKLEKGKGVEAEKKKAEEKRVIIHFFLYLLTY